MSHVYLVAAEDSGDAIGADVIDAMRAADPGVRISGIGGERMRAKGAAADVDLVVDMAGRLANSRQWPDWRPDSEFRNLREKSASARFR